MKTIISTTVLIIGLCVVFLLLFSTDTLNRVSRKQAQPHPYQSVLAERHLTKVGAHSDSTAPKQQTTPKQKLATAKATPALVLAARKQIGITTSYNPAYVKLSYPNGDVAKNTGVCTDVVIRAYREQGIDLQQLVHEDMKRHFSRYPKRWGLKRTDKNIDHRRVPNLRVFFTRKGKRLSISQQASDYQAGDMVTWLVGGKLPHIGIVSDKKTAEGTPLIIHNIGAGTQEEDVLFNFKITGHYRY